MNRDKDYSVFRIEDFVWDKHFRTWVLFPDPELNLFWRNWIAQNPEKLQTVSAAIEIILKIRVAEPSLSDTEIRLFVKNIRNKIDQQEYQKSRQPLSISKRIFPRLYPYVASASILLICAILIYILNPGSKSKMISYVQLLETAGSPLLEKVNHTTKPLLFTLADGSSVILEKNARISFSNTFQTGPRRDVYLSGEAFFNVTKNASRPFIVYANGLVTKVLGTSFRIKSYDQEKDVSVEVSSGNVSVFSFSGKELNTNLLSKKLTSNIILTRNQKVLFSREDLRFTKTIVAHPLPDPHKNYDFQFRETPASRVLDLVSRTYGIRIIYDRESYDKKTLTASLENKTMYQQLDIISGALGISYELQDGYIICSAIPVSTNSSNH